jgi:hypothetical protein
MAVDKPTGKLVAVDAILGNSITAKYMGLFYSYNEPPCSHNRIQVCRELWAEEVLGSPLLRTSAHLFGLALTGLSPLGFTPS